MSGLAADCAAFHGSQTGWRCAQVTQCDPGCARRLRDKDLPPLGVLLTDRTDQGCDWVLECPDVLHAEAEVKDREAASQHAQKTCAFGQLQSACFALISVEGPVLLGRCSHRDSNSGSACSSALGIAQR